MARRRPPLPERPRTKRSLGPFRLTDGRILFSRDVFGLAREISDDPRGTVWKLLGLMDGTRDLAALAARIQRSEPDLERPEIESAVARLLRLGVVEDANRAPPAEFGIDELERYARNFDFFSLVALGSSQSSYELQSRLKRARVTILGLGGIGSATALSLAASGVGSLRLVDDDRVEASNLNRQILYTSSDIGRMKSEVAADRIRALNPHVKVTAKTRRAKHAGDLAPLMQDCELFVLGADQPHDILLWTNDAAYAAGTPWLENSYGGPRCAVALFVPGKTPCLRCLEHGLVEKGRRAGTHAGREMFPHSASNPVIAPTANVAGHYGAMQGLLFLLGLPVPAEGRLIQLNLWRPNDTRVIRASIWNGCSTCGRQARSGIHAPGSSPPLAAVKDRIDGGIPQKGQY